MNLAVAQSDPVIVLKAWRAAGFSLSWNHEEIGSHISRGNVVAR